MRRILHVDMDAFFAAVEQRDDPALRGRPVAVGGSGPRGVIATASYEARRFGIGSAMPTRRALERCPELILLPPRMDAYREVSRQVRAVFSRYSDLVEPLSLDEAYLDVTRPLRGPESGTLLAAAIRRDIRAETGLTASAGVSTTKFVAKIASGMRKPDGLTVIPPEEVDAFVAALPVEAFFGVGPVTARRLHAMGVRTGADLRRVDLLALEAAFGAHGRHYHRIARGLDDRPVTPDRARKSLGRETTFERDLVAPDELVRELGPLCERLSALLRRASLVAGGLTVKVKYADHELRSRRSLLPVPLGRAAALARVAERLLEERLEPGRPVRLLGVTAFELQPAGRAPLQPPLFPFHDVHPSSS